MKKLTFLVSLLTLSSAFGAGKPIISVSIPPQAYIVEQLAGDLVEVNTLVGTQSSPTTYAPTPQDLAKLASSKLYFSIDVPFEQAWLARFKAQHTQIKVFDTSHSFDKLEFTEISHDSHEKHDKHEDHDPHAGHNHGKYDPHLWLSTDGLEHIAKHIAHILSHEFPNHTETLNNNLATFKSSLTALHKQIKELNLQSEFLVAHPSYGYFGREFGITQISMEQTGKQPSLRTLIALEKQIAEHGIKQLIVAPQFPSKIARNLSERLKLELHTLNPIAKNPLETITTLAEILERDSTHSHGSHHTH